MTRWFLLVYRLPPEPSAPRVAVWRALKKLGGAYLQDGTYVLKATELNGVLLRSLAHDVRNFGGEATVFEAERSDNERDLQRRLRRAEAAPERPRPRRPRRASSG